jgi:O-antigen/teichoic acid export membrane protein
LVKLMALSHRSQLLWSYTSTISSTILQFVAAVTITRFVAPSEYGLVALAMLCCRFPNYLSQLGMSRAVVQKPDLSEGNIRAAFTVSMGLGLAGCLVIAAVSPVLGRFFHEPRLSPVLMVLSLNFIFQGAMLVSGGLLRRALKMRQLAIADILSYLISTFAIGLPIAVKGYGAWAIVTATVTQTLITAVLYYALTRHSLWLTFCRCDYEHIVSFGGKATATSIVEGIGGSIDTFAIGKYSTALNVGLYNRSSLLIQLPVQNLSNGLTQVLFTRFSRSSAEGSANAFGLFARCQRIFLAIIFPLCAGAAAAAPCMISTLYGSKWSSAIPVFSVLCFSTAADASHHLPSIQMEAIGRFRHKMIVQIFYMLCIGGGVLISVGHGLVVVAMTITGLQFCRSLGLHFYTARYLNRSLAALMSSWIPGLTAAVPVGMGISLIVGMFLRYPGVPLVVQLSACILAGLVVSVAFYGVFFRKSTFLPFMTMIRAQRIPSSIVQVGVAR